MVFQFIKSSFFEVSNKHLITTIAYKQDLIKNNKAY